VTAALQNVAVEPIVLRELRDGIAMITLNRPAQRNALSTAMMTALQGELDRVRDAAAVKVVVIAANGPGFCAGHDLKEMRANPGRQFQETLFTQCSRLMTSIVRLPKIVIARVHGVAAAAGCQMVASCDLAVASTNAQFAVNGVNIGLFCSTPMVALTRAIGRKAAFRMLTTGEMIDAATAERLDLINQVVAPDALDTAVEALARTIADKSPLALKIGKEAFYRQAELDLDAAYKYAGGVMVENMMARDAQDGIDAFIAKRPLPEWKGR
jgi:enoyl-CoA hydratase/carnithine racemase